MAFEKLFEPIQVGSIELKNRYAYSPANCFYNWQGYMNEQELAYYTARAMGGTGLIIVGAYLSTKFGIPYANHPFMYVHDITHLPGLAALADNIRLGGSRSFVQLLAVPGGLGGNWKDVQPVLPSDVIQTRNLPPFPTAKLIQERTPDSLLARGRAESRKARAVTLEEIQTIINEHTYACRLAAYAGFDGIEVHLCHHYLMNSFRRKDFNRRSDRYGGSEENRNRICLELTEASLRAAREENPNVVVGVRVGCESDGYTFDETKRLAVQLQELGIDYWNVTWGENHTAHRKDGELVPFAKELKKILKIPVICPSIHDPKIAEEAVAEGCTDIVSTCRSMIADPDFVNKVKENRVDDIIKCTWCGMCSRGVPGLTCILNPETGRERYNPKYQIRQGPTGADYLPYVLQKPK